MMTRLDLMNSDSILKASNGAISIPDTLNYRDLKPVPEGLFCPKIFGEEEVDFIDEAFRERNRQKDNNRDTEERRIDSLPSGHIELPISIINPLVFHNKLKELIKLVQVSEEDFFNVLLFEDVEQRKTYDVRSSAWDFSKSLTEYQMDFLKMINPQLDIDILIELEPTIIKKGVIKKVSTTLEGSTGLKAGSFITSDIDDLINDLIPGSLSTLYGVEGISFLIQISKNGRKNCFSKFMESEKSLDWLGDVEDAIISRIPVIPSKLRPIIDKGSCYETSTINDLYRQIIISCNRYKELAGDNHYRLFRVTECLNIQYKANKLFKNVLCYNLPTLMKNKIFNLNNTSSRFAQTIQMIPSIPLSKDECVLDLATAINLFFTASLAELTGHLLREPADTDQYMLTVFGGIPQQAPRSSGIEKNPNLQLIRVLDEALFGRRGYNGLSKIDLKTLVDFFNQYTEGKCILLTVLDSYGQCKHISLKIARVEPRNRKNIFVHPDIFALSYSGEANIYSIITETAQRELKRLLLPSRQQSLLTEEISKLSIALLYEITRIDSKGKSRIICPQIEELENAVELRQLSYYDTVVFKVNAQTIETTIGRLLANSLLPEKYRDYHFVFDVEFLEILQESLKNDESCEYSEVISKINKYCDRIGSRMAIDIHLCKQKTDVRRESFPKKTSESFMKCFRFAGATYITKEYCGSEGSPVSLESMETAVGKTIAADVSIPIFGRLEPQILFEKGHIVRRAEIDFLKKFGIILPVVVSETIGIGKLSRLIEVYEHIDIRSSLRFGRIGNFTLNKQNIEVFPEDDIVEVHYYPADGFVLFREIQDCHLKVGAILKTDDLRSLANKGVRVIKVLPAVRVCTIKDCEEKAGVCAYCYGEFKDTGTYPPVGTNVGAIAALEPLDNKNREVLQRAFRQRHSLDFMHRLYFAESVSNTIFSSLFDETEGSIEYLSPISRAYLGMKTVRMEEVK